MRDTFDNQQPVDWKIIKLGDAATFINGYAFKPTDWKTEGLEIIRIQNLTKSSNSINYYDGEIKSRYKVVKGDFLISWSATLGIFEWAGKDAWLNQHLFKVVFDKKEFDKSFFKHLIQMSLEEMGKETHGSTMKHITKPRFDNFKIPYPPLVEQQKIAAILDAADSLRQKDQQLVERYTTLSQSLFLEMFGDPVTNPMGWEKISIAKLGVVSTGNTPPSSKKNMFGGAIPFVTPSDLDTENPFKRTVTQEGADNSRLVQAGALFVCCIGATIGKIRIAKNTCAFNQQINAIQWSNKISPLYGLHIFEFLRSEVIRRAISTTLPILKKSEFSKIECTVPPIHLQNQFAESIKLIEAQKQQAQASLQKSEALFNSLLQQAFTGELTRAPMERAA